MRWPIAKPVTPSPIAAMRPTISWPGTTGSLGFGSSPSTTCRSVRQTPQAATSTTISSAAGSGSGRSRMTSGRRGSSSTIARMTAAPAEIETADAVSSRHKPYDASLLKARWKLELGLQGRRQRAVP